PAGHTGLRSTVLIRPMEVVAPAAAANATVSMTPGYASRPLVPTVENPSSSARRAHSGITGARTLRIWLGSPIPILTWSSSDHDTSWTAPFRGAEHARSPTIRRKP